MSISKNSQNLHLDTKRHSFAHLMAAAVGQMFPEAQFGVGPVIENGCYYDFVLPRTLIPEDLPLLENKIKEMLKQPLVFKKQEIELSEAILLFEKMNQPLKVELLKDLAIRGTTSMSEEERADFSETEIIPYELKADIEKTVNKLNKLISNLESEDDSWEDHYNTLVKTLNKINLNKDFVSRNIQISEPINHFSYKRKNGSKVISDGKVNDIFTLIKFLRDVEAHPEGDNLVTVDENNNKLSANILKGYCPNAISINGVVYGCDYQDDIAINFGKGVIYVKRHLVAFAEQLITISNSSQYSTPTITIYRLENEKTGEDLFVDLCKGPHVEGREGFNSLRGVGFKLDKFSGSYWRGDQERNIGMQRLYALVFDTKEELKEFVNKREEAKKRDHRVLGQQLKLFTVSDLVGSGLPLFQPKGAIVRKLLEDYLWQLQKHSHQRVYTPHLCKEGLYEKSGHAGKYLDDMFSVYGGTSKETFYVKPMNCPMHMEIFADNQYSYKDMPVRYFDPTTVYRDEKTGQLSGLTRVRSITQDDGHLFCRVEQIQAEFTDIIKTIRDFYGSLGMVPDWVSWSVRDPNTPDKYLGNPQNWDIAEEAIRQAAEANGLTYKRVEGEAAFYGPKLDFMFKDCIDREWQLSTIQCDFVQPERFDLSFTNEEGEKERPVVIHRAISGSLERFIGVMTEHFGGRFPFWLAPTQVKILTVNNEKETMNYVAKIKEILDETVLMKPLKYNELRYEVDDRNESLGKKIREATMTKIPVQIIVGPKDIAENQVSVRTQEGEEKVKLEGLQEYLKTLG